MSTTTTALVGATGGAGTTRTAVEVAATLARDGRDVAVVDAAYATQGLAQYVGGRLDPDVTALVTDASDEPLDAALVDLGLETPGRVAVAPAAAPFERLARAKTPEAAQRLERRIDEASESFDHVLVDVPPVAANQAVAVVAAVERVVLVAPGTERGTDALQRMRSRLHDVGVAAAATVSTRDAIPDADAALPASETTAPDDAPVSHEGDGAFAAGAIEVSSVVVDDEVSVELEDGSLLETVEGYVAERTARSSND